MPGVKFVTSLEGVDPATMIVVATVPSRALGSVLSTLPPANKLEGLVATYNGTPPLLESFTGVTEPEHVVSMIPSGAVPGEPSTYFFKPGFPLIVGIGSRVAKDLQPLFGTTFDAEGRSDALRNQWTKIATNTTANSLATIFGIQVKDLRARINSEPNVDKTGQGHHRRDLGRRPRKRSRCEVR